MSENHQIYTIPGNYINSGKLWGMFDLRCVIEAAAIIAVVILPVINSGLRLEFKILISVATVILLLFFVGSGIRGDSITQYFKLVYRHMKNRRKMSYKIKPKEEVQNTNGNKRLIKTKFADNATVQKQ